MKTRSNNNSCYLPDPAQDGYFSAAMRTQSYSEQAISPIQVRPEVSASRVDAFLAALSHAEASALLLDFDGTLAPFRIDPTQVKPWAGIPELLGQIQETKRTRVAVISGRSAKDVARQLRMTVTPEIWGLHGAERLRPDGTVESAPIQRDQLRILEDAREFVHKSGILKALGLRLEEKMNAVVVHWRGKDVRSANIAREAVSTILNPFQEAEGIELMQFDGGFELRCGPNKGDALRSLLLEISPRSPVAFLGDDLTDEYAFRALEGRGLSVLVRRVWRPTAATTWLRPPHELKDFFIRWLAAVRRC